MARSNGASPAPRSSDRHGGAATASSQRRWSSGSRAPSGCTTGSGTAGMARVGGSNASIRRARWHVRAGSPSRRPAIWYTWSMDEGPGDLEVDLDSFARAYESGARVLDVRNPDEYRAAHVPGAVLIPLPELAARQEE